MMMERLQMMILMLGNVGSNSAFIVTSLRYVIHNDNVLYIQTQYSSSYATIPSARSMWLRKRGVVRGIRVVSIAVHIESEGWLAVMCPSVQSYSILIGWLLMLPGLSNCRWIVITPVMGDFLLNTTSHSKKTHNHLSKHSAFCWLLCDVLKWAHAERHVMFAHCFSRSLH